MILITTYTKFTEIPTRIKIIVNLFLSLVRIKLLDRPPLPSQNLTPWIILSSFVPAFIIKSFNGLSIYFKEVLNMRVLTDAR